MKDRWKPEQFLCCCTPLAQTAASYTVPAPKTPISQESGSKYLPNTEDRIDYLNELFLTDTKYYKEKELMQEYGFSEENPMTFEWVISHPKEAYALVTITWEPYSFFPMKRRVLEDSFFEKFNIPILPDNH